MLWTTIRSYLWNSLGYEHVFLVTETETAVAVVAPDIYEPAWRICERRQLEKKERNGTDPSLSIAIVCWFPQAMCVIFLSSRPLT